MKRSQKVVAVIPARMESTRYPGKPLVKILDLPMIEHVRRRAALNKHIDEVYVATCNQEIMDVVEQYGGKAIMTANTHERCTDRVEEAIQSIEADIVLIFQGDEPLFDPKVAELLVDPLLADENILCTNLISVIKDEKDLEDNSIVKTVLNQKNDVLYFSRSAIPFQRIGGECALYRQTGLSAFRRDFLVKFSHLEPTPLEIAESVDFNRILEHDYVIRAVVFDQPLFGVDEPEHVGRIERILKEDDAQTNFYKEIMSS